MTWFIREHVSQPRVIDRSVHKSGPDWRGDRPAGTTQLTGQPVTPNQGKQDTSHTGVGWDTEAEALAFAATITNPRATRIIGVVEVA